MINKLPKILTILSLIIALIISVDVTYGKPVTANEFIEFCNQKPLFCNGYYAGFLDGLVSGTSIVDWNLPQNRNYSAANIRNSFIKFLNDHPIAGDKSLGTVVTVSLVKDGALKAKNQH